MYCWQNTPSKSPHRNNIGLEGDPHLHGPRLSESPSQSGTNGPLVHPRTLLQYGIGKFNRVSNGENKIGSVVNSRNKTLTEIGIASGKRANSEVVQVNSGAADRRR